MVFFLFKLTDFERDKLTQFYNVLNVKLLEKSYVLKFRDKANYYVAYNKSQQNHSKNPSFITKRNYSRSFFFLIHMLSIKTKEEIQFHSMM